MQMSMKVDDPRDTSSSSVKTLEHFQPQNHLQMQMSQNHQPSYQKGDEEMANNFSMMMPNGMFNGRAANDVFKQFNLPLDQVSALFGGALGGTNMVPKEDIFNLTKMLGGLNSNANDVDKFYRGLINPYNGNNNHNGNNNTPGNN